MSERYDPQAVEGDVNRGNHYVSKRDVKILAVLLVVGAVVLYPVYQYGLKARYRLQSASSMKAIFEATSLYAEGHDAGLPPLFRAGEGGRPDLNAKGLPYTWVSDVAPNMTKRASFSNPAASPAEFSRNEDGASTTNVILSAFGMYAPYGGFKTYNVDSPNNTVLFAETSNGGSNGTFDPQPFGPNIPDGMVIGYDTGDPFPDRYKSRFITRLAFPGSGSGIFRDDTPGRHPSGSHFMTAGGGLLTLKAPAAKLRLSADGYPAGIWRTPPQRAR